MHLYRYASAASSCPACFRFNLDEWAQTPGALNLEGHSDVKIGDSSGIRATHHTIRRLGETADSLVIIAVGLKAALSKLSLRKVRLGEQKWGDGKWGTAQCARNEA